MSRVAVAVYVPPVSRTYCLAHVVPHLLGVDDHAVQVEDDGFDHSALVAAVHVGERRRGGPFLDREDLADEERVIAGAQLARPCARSASPAAPASRRGSSSRRSMPSQSTIGGTLRAKCCARCSCSPESSDAAHCAGVAQQLVERRVRARPRCRRAAARARARRATRPSARACARRPPRRRPTPPPASGGRARAVRPRGLARAEPSRAATRC